MTQMVTVDPAVQLNFSITHQKVIFAIDLDDGGVKGSIKFTIKPLSRNLNKIYLNARDLDIQSIKFNELLEGEFVYNRFPETISDLISSDYEDLKNANKWLKSLKRNQTRELEIAVPSELILPIENVSNVMSDETITAPVSVSVPVVEVYQNIYLTIDYVINPSKLNFGSISIYKARPNQKKPIRYIQLLGNSFDEMGRYLMPCLDFPGERLANWDLEYSVKSGEWQDVFDRIHLVSSGVLCRQFVNFEKTVKVFHYKIQDIPCLSNQISFLVGIFDAVKIPNVPFAYAFSPIGKSLKLTNCMEFFGKAFNFYNWFLNSSGGNLKSLSSLSSEVFPFPSYYLIFVKDLPKSFISCANLTLISSDILCESTDIDQTFETRRILCKVLAEQYFNLRIDLKSQHDAWIIKGIVNYLSELQLRTFHGNNDYRLGIKNDIERLVSLENTENLYVPPLSILSAYLQEHEGKLNPIDRANLKEILELKSRLIFVILERKIEKTFLQKLLSLIYAETLINRHREGFSCQLFLKLIKRLTGKDLKSFTDQWIFNSGCPMFSLNFFHNRKRSMIEFEISSLKRFGSVKFSGNLTVRIVESEQIVHEHVVHIDESTSKFDVPFHSKAKRPRKKKIVTEKAMNEFDSQDEDEEVSRRFAAGFKQTQTQIQAEEDESLNETLVSPISWIRIDPEMEWLAQFSLNQPDIMWIEALENDRDVVAQWEAVKALPQVSSTSESACFALERFINDWKAFWAVRVEAVNSMALIGASLQESPVRLLGARKLIELFNKKFGHPNPSLLAYPKANTFEILPNYLLQCAIPRGISIAISAALENSSNDGPRDCDPLEPFLAFFSDVLKYNDNSGNNGGFSDGEYLATIIKCGTKAFSRIQTDESVMMKFRNQLDQFVDQLNRYARLEMILPSFRNVIMSSVLEAASVLTPETEVLNPRALEAFLGPLNHVQVRLDTFRYFAGHFRDSRNCQDAFNLLNLISTIPSTELRLKGIEDVSLFELLQFLRDSMDDESVDLKSWLLKTRVTEDPQVLRMILAALSVLEGGNAEESNLVPTKLKITLNLGNTSGTTALDSMTTSTVMTTPSIDDEDDIWLRELTGDQSTKKPFNQSQSQSLTQLQGHQQQDQNTPQYEREMLSKIWQVIWSNYDSIPFRYPVDPSVPGYYAIIKNPMDLSTAKDRLSTFTCFLMDLRQIFQNCFTFNQPDSLIYDQAKRLRSLALNELKSVFPREKKLIKRVLKSAQEDVNLLQTINEAALVDEQRRRETEEDDDVFMTSKIPKLSIKLGTGGSGGSNTGGSNTNGSNTNVSNTGGSNIGGSNTGVSHIHTLDTPSSTPQLPSSDRQKMKNILQKLCKHRHAYFFLEPVDPVALNIPTYFEIISTPMDFGTINKKLASYENVDDFAGDCRLVFSNCKTFNSPETLVYQIAMELEKLFEADWSKFKMPSSPKKQQAHEVQPKIKISLNLGGFKK